MAPDAGLLGISGKGFTPLALHAAKDRRVRSEGEEERRILYVAMTRPKSRLCIAIARGRRQKDHWHPAIMSALGEDASIARWDASQGAVGGRVKHHFLPETWPSAQSTLFPLGRGGFGSDCIASRSNAFLSSLLLS